MLKKTSSQGPHSYRATHKLGSGERGKGRNARFMMATLDLYHTDNINDDPELIAYERDMRADLEQIVNELDRTDVIALHNLARLLILEPRDDESLFGFIEEKSRMVLARYGIGGES